MSGSEHTGGPTPSRRSFLRTAAAGATAAAVGAGATGTAVAQQGNFDGWMEDAKNYDGTVVDETGSDQVTITVGAGDAGLAFGPAAVQVSPGTTVTWEWNGEGGAHNVVGENADFKSGEPVAEAGTTFEQTFEDEGTIKYYCDPHLPVGMKGVVVVGEMESGGGDGGGGDGDDDDGGFTLTPGLGALGGALVLGVLSPIIFAAVLAFKRGELGGSTEATNGAGPAAAAASGEAFATADAPVEEPAVEIGHDEYDPTGTAALIAGYFVILVLLWVFMYFVEFLGNGPTIIG